jgi:hypothetical protein
MKLHFGELPIGTWFTFFGKRYRKTAPSMTMEENGPGSIFMAEAVVEVEGELKELLPWKPDPPHYTVPAPRGYRAKDGRWIKRRMKRQRQRATSGTY